MATAKSEPGISIQFYHDLDEKPPSIHYPPSDKPLIVENICIEAAQKLGIGSRHFHLFGLFSEAKYDGIYTRIWLPPNYLVGTIDNGAALSLSYTFSVRYRPHLHHLQFIDDRFNDDASCKAFMTYFQLQCRSDFVNDVFSENRTSDKDVHANVLGLGAYDMYTFCRKNSISLDEFMKRYKHYIPFSFLPKHATKPLNGPFCDKRLKNSLKHSLKNMFEDVQKMELVYNRHVLGYMDHMFRLMPHYGQEQFRGELQGQSKVITVDLHHLEGPGLFIKHDTKHADQFEPVCSISDLTGISYFEYEKKHGVVLSRKSGMAISLMFTRKDVTLSLLSLLDAAYRLSVDWYYHLVSDNKAAEMESGMLSHLRRIHCYPPVSTPWARQRLKEVAAANQGGSWFLLCQEPSSLTDYRVYLPSLREHLPITKKADGKLQLAVSNEPAFLTIEELLKHYRDSPPSGPVQMQNQVRLKAPYDSKNYVIVSHGAVTAPTGGKDIGTGGGMIVQDINLLEGIAAGACTLVHKGIPSGDLEHRAIKMLKPEMLKPEYSGIEADWRQSVQSILFWKHSAIVAVHCMTIWPLQVALDLSEHGDLLSYLRNPHKQLMLEQVVSAAEQLTEAMRYLHEDFPQGQVHGNIQCRNILVFSHDNTSFQVKLSDSGLVHFYNTRLPLDHAVNQGRYAWLAPEYLSDLPSGGSTEADCYAAGTAFWEMFTGGEVPYTDTPPRQVFDKIQAGVVLPRPSQCPDEMYVIMQACWASKPEQRKQPKEMLRDIRSISSEHDFLKKSGNSRATAQQNGAHAGGDKAEIAVEDEPNLSSPLNPSRIVASPFPAVNPLLNLSHFPGQSNGLFPLPVPHPSLPGGAGAAHSSMPLPTTPADVHSEFFIRKEELHLDSKKLGEGHYGRVFQGTYTKNNEVVKVAVKMLKKNMYEKYKADFDKELKIMLDLKHPNILRILGYSKEDEKDMKLVLEYQERGSLLNHLKAEKQRNLLTQPLELLEYTLQICAGMVYLSGKSLVHCDLAARNILVSKNRILKISDFGLSKSLEPQKDYYRARPERDIPVNWCAPEVMCERKYTERSDVWAFGITMWEVFTCGKPPNLLTEQEKKDKKQVEMLIVKLQGGQRLPKPDSCSDNLYQVMRHCWEWDTHRRGSFQEVDAQLNKNKRELQASSSS